METDEARSLALALKKLLEQAHNVIDESQPAPELVTRITDHVGCGLKHLVVVTQTFPVWEHVNLQRGLDAYLDARPDDGAQWFGLAGQGRHHQDTIDMLTVAERRLDRFEIGSVDYTTAAVGPDSTTEVVTFGFVLSRAPGGAPVVLVMRGPAEQFGMEGCRIEVLAAARADATATRDEIQRLMTANDVFKGQILTFGFSEHLGNKLVSFVPRPVLGSEQVILPEGVLESIERHVVGIAEHAGALRSLGQHLKRGLLLYGAPGTGKTHTVRYLMGRLPEVTVVVMTGAAMRFVAEGAALARRLQPAVVVLEDVDLVASDRSFGADGNPLLFSLLDAMDGVGSDADVTFVLTTNRVEVLERALADRPGRVDLAVEVPRPDADARGKLLRLYGRELDLTADLDEVVQATEGVTASFFKELVRRAVLAGLRAGSPPRLLEALREMTDDRAALTRVLLGSGEGTAEPLDLAVSPMAPVPTRMMKGRVYRR
ncbi:AAA family ATPase [Nonomuraea sp. NPDC050663]|uniref:AAA family ATPase n=1 Tax=Nonomuraea sp. NPDC050663 TaxID=3364370 RepID=UPI0037AC249A